MTSLPSGGHLLVPVANPETVDRLLDTAIEIARDRSMTIKAVHVVEVPAQVPLSEGDRLLENNGQRQMLDGIEDRCSASDVPVDTWLRYARDVATGIVGAVDEHDVDAILMGWRGRPRRRDIVLGSFLDRILGDASCDVFVKRIRRPPDGIESILVPVAGGPHCDLSVTLAETIARQREAAVRLVHAVDEDAADTTIDRAGELLESYTSTLETAGIEADSAMLRTDHISGALTDETAHHDLTILGATEEPFLKRRLVGSVSENVGRSAASQVILARKYVAH